MIRLCSSSQTRADLLRSAGIEFIQSGVDFDEDAICAENAKNFVYQATLGKYKQALKEYDFNDLPLLVADTVVTSHDQILRKATSVENAKDILYTQSGSTTSIITCMIYKSSQMELLDISTTTYQFAKFDRDDVERYLQSDEWRGKAGACMVEGFCKKYITSVHGAESTAMGLHVELLKLYM
jgi:septum formation protein